MNAVAQQVPVFAPAHSLRVTDRCDRCAAQARVRVQVNEPEYEIQSDGTPVQTGEGVLDFCNHHYGKHELALLATGAKVIDVCMEGI